MKIYDRVRLKTRKKEFLDKGYDVGAEATVLEERNKFGFWLIEFDGEVRQDKDGVYFYTGEVMCAEDEDLEKIE